MVKSPAVLILLLMLHTLVWAGDAEAPTLELLEFLVAEGTEVDGLWLDPILMNELTQRDEALGEEPQSDE